MIGTFTSSKVTWSFVNTHVLGHLHLTKLLVVSWTLMFLDIYVLQSYL